MKQGIWLLPSRRRTEKLARFFHQAVRTGMSTPGIVLVSPEDFPEYQKVTLPKGWAVLPVEAEGVGATIRAVTPELKGTDWVGYLVDDQMPHSYKWDTRLLEHLDGKNLVSTDDGEHGPKRIVGGWAWSTPLIEAVGYIYPEGMRHLYMDDLWYDLAIHAGCWTYVADVLVTHEHPFKAPGEMDETHSHVYDRQAADKVRYEKWKAEEMAGAIERIRALQAGA